MMIDCSVAAMNGYDRYIRTVTERIHRYCMHIFVFGVFICINAVNVY